MHALSLPSSHLSSHHTHEDRRNACSSTAPQVTPASASSVAGLSDTASSLFLSLSLSHDLPRVLTAAPSIPVRFAERRERESNGAAEVSKDREPLSAR